MKAEIERVKYKFIQNFELPLPPAALEKVYQEMLAEHIKVAKKDYLERSQGQKKDNTLSGIWKAIPDIVNKNLAGYNPMKKDDSVTSLDNN